MPNKIDSNGIGSNEIGPYLGLAYIRIGLY